MFRSDTDYERAVYLYKYLSSGEYFKHKKDLGDIYEIESDGVDLKFFNIVKARRTGKFYMGKEILLLNVTTCDYVNFEGKSKYSMIMSLEKLFLIVLQGFELKSFNEEFQENWSIMGKKYKRKLVHNQLVPAETDTQHIQRAKIIYDQCKKMYKGLFNNFVYYFVGDDPQMDKPLNFIGYYYYLARCLNDISNHPWRLKSAMKKLEGYFGSHAQSIDEKYQEYLDIASCVGVETRAEYVTCNYNSLEEIQKNIRSRIYVFYEVIKYFFKNGRLFKDVDHKNINKRSYNIRVMYSALGGKVCLKEGEYNDVIAYFTALRAEQGDLPLLINVIYEPALEVLRKRFDNAV